MLGVTVRIPTTTPRARKPFNMVSLKMANRLQMCVGACLSLIVYMVHIKDPFYNFVLKLCGEGEGAPPAPKKAGVPQTKKTGHGAAGDGAANNDHAHEGDSRGADGDATVAPTSAEAVAPTVTPTMAPTVAPTVGPTVQLTFSDIN